jgi:hypothetical protein
LGDSTLGTSKPQWRRRRERSVGDSVEERVIVKIFSRLRSDWTKLLVSLKIILIAAARGKN